MACSEYEDPTPTDKEARADQDDSFRPPPCNAPLIAFWTIVVMFALAFALWPSKSKPQASNPIKLPSLEITALKEISDKVTKFDTAITAEERAIENLKPRANPTDQNATREWCRHLAILAQLKAGRYEYVRIYNLSVSKIPPNVSVYDELPRHNLPVAIH